MPTTWYVDGGPLLRPVPEPDRGVGMVDLELRRGLPVPVERVWHAFTDPDALVGWFWPARFQTSATVDLRVGGRYRIAGGLAGGLAVCGEYLELQPPRLM